LSVSVGINARWNGKECAKKMDKIKGDGGKHEEREYQGKKARIFSNLEEK
jgi:hypothetical protein